MKKTTDRLELLQWAYLSEFMQVIDHAIFENRQSDAALLAKLALNISHDPNKFPFDASLLRQLNGYDFPLAMQFIGRQRGLTASQWNENRKDAFCSLTRLRRIAGVTD